MAFYSARMPEAEKEEGGGNEMKKGCLLIRRSVWRLTMDSDILGAIGKSFLVRIVVVSLQVTGVRAIFSSVAEKSLQW